jgi:hypothetical protein
VTPKAFRRSLGVRWFVSKSPKSLRALDAIAYNAACDSLLDGKGRLLVNWRQSLFRHFYPFNGTDFPHTHGLPSTS